MKKTEISEITELQYATNVKKILNTEEPIFVMYVNIDGLSKRQAGEILSHYRELLNYDNVTVFIIPTKDRTELLWLNNPTPQYVYTNEL